MALTPAEKQKAYRERQKEKAKDERHKGGDAAAGLFRTPFSEWAQHNNEIDELINYSSLAGFELPAFEDERDPEAFVIDRECHGEGDMFGEAKGALGRAEVTISILQDVALLLATSVNSYKRQEIVARLSELENSDTTDRAMAMSEAVKLNKMLDQLDKQVRRSFPQWKVTDV
ncbi:MAG TPA: hypothetical protein DIT67_01780 [Octadecabacter sp.]|nr:hypothetical protein [Octadecabacter sp.]